MKLNHLFPVILLFSLISTSCTQQGFDYYDVLKGQGPCNDPPMLTQDPVGNVISLLLWR